MAEIDPIAVAQSGIDPVTKSPLSADVRKALFRRTTTPANVFGRGGALVKRDDPTAIVSAQTQQLSTFRDQLNVIRAEVTVINTGLASIAESIRQDSALEQQRLLRDQEQERQLSEQKVRIGQETELERKIKNAIAAPVVQLQKKVGNIFSRIAEALTTLFFGWLTNQGIEALKAYEKGDREKLEKIKNNVLKNVAIAIGTVAAIKIGFGLVIKSIKGISGKLLGLAFNLALAPLRFAGSKLSKLPLIGGLFNRAKPAAPASPRGRVPVTGGNLATRISNFFRGGGGASTAVSSSAAAAKSPIGGLPWLSGILSFSGSLLQGESLATAAAGAGGGMAGGIMGGKIGTKTGAAIGSFLGPWGTAGGAFLGGLGGFGLGFMGGEGAGKSALSLFGGNNPEESQSQTPRVEIEPQSQTPQPQVTPQTPQSQVTPQTSAIPTQPQVTPQTPAIPTQPQIQGQQQTNNNLQQEENITESETNNPYENILSVIRERFSSPIQKPGESKPDSKISPANVTPQTPIVPKTNTPEKPLEEVEGNKEKSTNILDIFSTSFNFSESETNKIQSPKIETPSVTTPSMGPLPKPKPNVVMLPSAPSKSKTPALSPSTSGTDVPLINSSNPDNFYVLYSQLNYNVVT